ncbi:hypothetical protein COV20_02530 [Candidatus Woesearchaeota archaeon CG10_big_fil_rev_8_21_14_0_10_45_16]|nr:MAG: hypothetical protein COV20_02530 [Candidatus Woesearchaeota archaeon CG10_big_fil_rev_8_21_14_0_10_45_16]
MATDLTSIVNYFQTYGVLDFLLPFILVFTIIFAVLQKTKILGDRKNFNVIIALVLGLLFVVPHITGNYPGGFDPVAVINEALPSISLVAVAAIMLLLLLGIFSTTFARGAAPLIAVAAIGFVLYIFGSALDLWRGPYDLWNWWTAETTELVIIILVFGVVVWFITKEPGEGSGVKVLKEAGKAFGSLFERK